ncbi:MAG: DMT family transporter [Firmicutes bacterium]|nr:DMT family transporter [Bacillota bacterium]
MSLKTWMAVGVTLLFWSSAFAGIKAGLAGGYGAGQVVLLRFLSASAVFILYAIFRRIAIPRREDVPKIIVLGLTGISLYHIALTFGELTVSAGVASLIIAVAPVFTAVVAAWALKERLTLWGWVGLALGFAGVALITLDSSHDAGFTRGAVLILVSAIATAFFFVYQKPLFARYRAVDLTAYFTWIGVTPMLVFMPGLVRELPHATLSATLACLYIGVFPAAIAYVAWAYALSTGRATTVSSTLYVNPLLAILIAWVWLRELPPLSALLGGTVAIAGVLMVSFLGKKRLPIDVLGTNTGASPAIDEQEGECV